MGEKNQRAKADRSCVRQRAVVYEIDAALKSELVECFFSKLLLKNCYVRFQVEVFCSAAAFIFFVAAAAAADSVCTDRTASCLVGLASPLM